MERVPFITFEGIEGAGKTTLVAFLAEWLQAQGISVLTTREPGGSPIGGYLRELILHHPVHPRAELFLFLAERAQHVSQVIHPALEAGQWVLCDRYTDSTLAYQGYGRGADLATLRLLNQIATEGLEPDLTVLIDLPVEVALSRASDPNRFEHEPQEFHERVRQGYLQESRQFPRRYVVLDGTQPLPDLQEALRQVIVERWGERLRVGIDR
ncbi:MAG: dTMP kinase [Fimbriimonadales bacterium]